MGVKMRQKEKAKVSLGGYLSPKAVKGHREKSVTNEPPRKLPVRSEHN